MQHRVGRKLPDVELRATSGAPVNPSRLSGRTVLFCYPWTGRPGHPNPLDWDNIPGAHGSTPQVLAYAETYNDFSLLGVNLLGLSRQDSEWQREFAERNSLPFRLLSDTERKFSTALTLPYFTTGGIDYLQRLTIIAIDGVIDTIRFPVTAPEQDAREVLALLQDR